MSSRRKKCNSIAAMRQKKLIDKRLLQISILVEDYIFEGKPIGRHEAEIYAKEVASYESKCLGDERSLQVIEKLRRHMRSIIAEQGQPIDEDIFTQPLLGTTPIYPIQDDMTQYIQDTEVEDHTQGFDSLNCVEEPVRNGEIKRKATVKRNIRDNSELVDDLTQFTQDTDIEDLTQGFNSLNYIQTPIKEASNKRKAVKRHMGKTYDMTQSQDADIDDDIQEINSQSSVNKPNTRARNKRSAIVKRNICKTKDKINVLNNYNSDIDVIDIRDDDDDDKATGCNNSVNVEVSPQDTISSFHIDNNEVRNTPAVCSPSILTSFDAVPVIYKSNEEEVSEKSNKSGKVISTDKNVDESIKTVIKENNGLQIKFTDRKLPEKGNIPFFPKDNAIKGIDNKKTIPINNKNNINILRNTHNTSDNKKTTVNPSDISKNKAEKAQNTNPKANKLKKGLNDLSWVENIKYVREIAKEEYVNILTPDNFWDNYTLPEKWNDDDFLYN